jgi:hypothetical protein
MQKLKIIFFIVIGWFVVAALYAYYYVVTILALPEDYDAYARNWQFQLLMFCIFRLPYLVLLLTILIGLVITLPRRNKPRRIQ